MPRLVKINGVTHSFPDDATDAEISAALGAIPENNAAAAPKAQTWSEQLGLHKPTESVGLGFLRGAGTGVVDLAQGAVANVTGQLNAKLDAENTTRRTMGAPETATLPRVNTPENFSGKVGAAMPMVAEMVIPTGGVAKKAYEAIPNAARAGQKFQSVMAAAKDIPINVGETGDVALRIMQLAERGGSMPLAVRKLLNRVTDPSKAPMVYEEARDFASNISRLSKNEFGRLTPAVAREVANLRVKLNAAVAEAAKQAGKADEYASAMKEYSQAMRLKEAVDKALNVAKKSAPYATAAGAGAWLTRQIHSALGGD